MSCWSQEELMSLRSQSFLGGDDPKKTNMVDSVGVRIEHTPEENK
jgi:hypothetical protein